VEEPALVNVQVGEDRGRRRPEPRVYKVAEALGPAPRVDDAGIEEVQAGRTSYARLGGRVLVRGVEVVEGGVRRRRENRLHHRDPVSVQRTVRQGVSDTVALPIPEEHLRGEDEQQGRRNDADFGDL